MGKNQVDMSTHLHLSACAGEDAVEVPDFDSGSKRGGGGDEVAERVYCHGEVVCAVNLDRRDQLAHSVLLLVGVPHVQQTTTGCHHEVAQPREAGVPQRSLALFRHLHATTNSI